MGISIFNLTKRQKRAMVGIGTLIVFIAAILTAAIAAGVIIRTSGVLQERSYAVAGQARKRLVTGLEVTEVYGNANTTAATIPQLEINVRLRPGASEVNLRQMGLTLTTQTFARAATLQHSSANRFTEDLVGATITNESWYALTADLNNDGVTDYLKVSAYAGTDYLLFNISNEGVANVSLGADISDATSNNVNVTLSESPILIGGETFGFVSLDTEVTQSNNVTAQIGDTFAITQVPMEDSCTWQTLIPERFFCYRTKLGDADPILEPGESLVIYYKFRDEYALGEDDELQVSFVPKDGAITYMYSKIPSVVRVNKILIWPD